MASEKVGASLKPGDVVVNYCEPFVKSLMSDFRNTHCNHCFVAKKDLKSCGLCKMVSYCNRSCQVADWNNGHKVECKLCQSKILREYCLSSPNVEYNLFVLRLYALFKMKQDLAKKPFTASDGTFLCFDNLPYHYGGRCMTKTMMRESHDMAYFINVADEKSTVDARDLFRWYGVIQKNSICLVSDSEWVRIGWGIYFDFVGFKHSYKPTAVLVNMGPKLQARAIAPIPEGEKPCISHLFNNLDKLRRQIMLREYQNMECCCEKCESCSDSGVDYERLNYLLEKMTLFEECLDKSEWSEVYTTHKEIVFTLRQIYHEYDHRIAQQLMSTLGIGIKLGVNKLLLKKLNKETGQHFRITYGEEHACYENFKKISIPYFR